MILCLGETIVDLVCEREVDAPERADSFTPYPGGALANVAVAASRTGGEAALASGVGSDPWGRWLRAGLEAEGVDARWLATVDGLRTPVAFVTFDRRREATFHVYGEGIEVGMRAAGGALDAALERASALVFGSNTLVGEPERLVTLDARREALERGLPVLFDPNLRPTRWQDLERALELSRELCEGAFLVRANREEAAALTGEADPEAAADAMCAMGARLGVVTLGPEGALIRGEARAAGPSPGVDVIAPLGAGDAFLGALAAGLSRVGWDASRAAEALPGALAAGARACTGWSAQS